MEGSETEEPFETPGGASRRRRNRNRNRNAKSSRSPSRGSDDAFEGKDGHRRQPGGRSNNSSMSPTRKGSSGSKGSKGNKSRSPTRRDYNSNGNNNKSKSPTRNHRRRYKGRHGSSEMTVICFRSDLWDSAAHFQPDESQQLHLPPPDTLVRPYRFVNDKVTPPSVHANPHGVAVVRVPHHFEPSELPKQYNENGELYCDVVDTSIPNPHDPDIVHDKYWAQRRRLFSRFDQGIKLDAEGWYSVTPEIIADHVARRVADLATKHVIPYDSSQGIVVFDAFCGCGGNTIAFGKMPSNIISKVVCVDTDRSKLLKAAHNASLYGIPKDKLVFIECNSSFLLSHAYHNGEFILDKPAATLPPYFPPPVAKTTEAGYLVGGLDLLPRRIDVVFMDPPWGGVDYEVLGKNGYDLQKNMKISMAPHKPLAPAEEEYQADGDGCDDFFDTFSSPSPRTPTSSMSQKARKANFNKHNPAEDCIDGMELLRVAAGATSSHVVIYDLPRNTNKYSLGKCALGAGYRGNLKLEEHYLNGRLKTVTAYLGVDHSELINSLVRDEAHYTTSGDEA